MKFPFIAKDKSKIFQEEDTYYPYAIPQEELFPEYPWPKSLCPHAQECPVNDIFDNIQDVYKCPHAFQDGCPLFFLHFDEFAELESIKDVEIFEVGQDGTQDWTEADLDQIVANFKKGVVDPPLVALGHDEDQSLLKKAGLPAAGWIANLKKQGTKLYADLKDVPQKVAEALKNKAYKYVSAEIYPFFVKNGENLGKVLRRIALLGADIPKVKSLNEVLARYDENEPETILIGANDMTEKLKKELEETKAQAKKFSEELEAKKAEFQKLLDEKTALEAKLKSGEPKIHEQLKKFSEELKAKNDEIKSLKERSTVLEQTLAAQKRAAHLREIDQFCEDLKKKGLSAAIEDAGLKNFLLALNDKTTIKFSEDDEQTPFAKAKQIFSEIGKLAKKGSLFVPQGQLQEPEPLADDVDPEAAELNQKILKYAHDNNVDYETAYEAVMAKGGN